MICFVLFSLYWVGFVLFGRENKLNSFFINAPISTFLSAASAPNDADIHNSNSNLDDVMHTPKVKDNISYRPHGDMVDDAVDSYVETAASASHATTFVNELQDKFDYRVGRFGSRLSGGQCTEHCPSGISSTRKDPGGVYGRVRATPTRVPL